MNFLSRGVVFVVVLGSLLCGACGLEPLSDPGPVVGTGSPSASTSAAPSASGAIATPGIAPPEAALSTDPLLVDVDADRTLTAEPGAGTGVFIEYASGGQWHVWWTCDAAAARENETGGCMFDLDVSSASRLEDPVYDAEGTNGPMAILSGDPRHFKAHTTTLSAASGVSFTSDPGATVRLELQIDGKNVAPFFFVEDGALDGGFAEALTDPLLVRGATP